MSNLEREAPCVSLPLRAAVLHYFQWLSTVPPPGTVTTNNTKRGSKVLAALLEEFPDLGMFAFGPAPPVPELKVRFDSYPFHMSRLHYLENRVALLEMMVLQGTPGTRSFHVPPPPPQGTQTAIPRSRPPASVPAPPSIAAAAANKKVGPTVLRPPAASKQPPSAAPSTQQAASRVTTSSETTALETTPTNRKRKNPPNAAENSKDSQHERKKRKKAAKGDGLSVSAWKKRYEQLKQYHKDCGHCRVPDRYEHAPGLAGWVRYQRREYEEKKLTPEKFAKLKELDFQWVLPDSGRPHKTWEEHFQELKEFHRENGHTRVPRRTYKKNPFLGEWVHYQRRNYEKKSPFLLQSDKMKKLQEIGFEFQLPEKRKSWDERFEQLVQFRETHGHCNVPIPREKRENSDTVTPKTVKQANGETVVLRGKYDDKVTFAHFVRLQKVRYLKYKNGDRKALTESRFQKLHDLGFGMDSEQPSVAPK